MKKLWWNKNKFVSIFVNRFFGFNRWSGIWAFSCFYGPDYLSKTYKINYRVQAYAASLFYNKNSKFDNLIFDVGGKHPIKRDNLKFFKHKESTHYGKLINNKDNLYRLFPSLKRNLLTVQPYNDSYCKLDNVSTYRSSAINWINNITKPLIKRRKNYLIQHKLIYNEIDQSISQFNINWPNIHRVKSSSYSLLSKERYYTMFVDSQYNWKADTYNYFRYFNKLQIRSMLWSQRMSKFWTFITTNKLFHSAINSIEKIIKALSKQLVLAIQNVLNLKLQFILSQFKIKNAFKFNALIKTSLIYLYIIIFSLFSKQYIYISWKINVIYSFNNKGKSNNFCLHTNSKSILSKRLFTLKYKTIIINAYNFYNRVIKYYKPFGTAHNYLNNTRYLRNSKNKLLSSKWNNNFPKTVIKLVNKLQDSSIKLPQITFILNNLTRAYKKNLFKKIFSNYPKLTKNNLTMLLLIKWIKLTKKIEINKKVKIVINKKKAKKIIKLLRMLSKNILKMQWISEMFLWKKKTYYGRMLLYYKKLFWAKKLIIFNFTKYKDHIKLYKFKGTQKIKWRLAFIAILKKFRLFHNREDYNKYRELFQYLNIIYKDYGLFKGFLKTINNKQNRFQYNIVSKLNKNQKRFKSIKENLYAKSNKRNHLVSNVKINTKLSNKLLKMYKNRKMIKSTKLVYKFINSYIRINKKSTNYRFKYNKLLFKKGKFWNLLTHYRTAKRMKIKKKDINKINFNFYAQRGKPSKITK